jgi:hypothetical protein
MYGAVRRACPDFEVRITPKEVAWVAAANVAMLVFVLVYSHFAEAQA